MKAFLLFLSDTFILAISLFLTLMLYLKGDYQSPLVLKHYYAYIFIFPFWYLFFYIEGLYSLRQLREHPLLISLLRSLFLSTIVSYLVFYLFQPQDLTPKTNGLILTMFSLVGLTISRQFLYFLFESENLAKKIIAIGPSSLLSELNQEIKKKPHLGYRLIQQANHYQDIEDWSNATLVTFDRTLLKDKALSAKLITLLHQEIELVDLTKLIEMISGKIPLSIIEESWFIDYCSQGERRGEKVAKKILDLSVSLTLTLIILPFFLVLLVFLLIFSGKPLFYSQIRMGLNNKTFTIFKLRTMTVEAEKNGAQWAKPGDARVTQIGKFLRMTRLDELPQLFNIIKGDMSLVGPRPERPEIIRDQLSPHIPLYHHRHLVKPGVTGWAQVNFRYGFSLEDSVEKLQYDLFYIKNQNIWLDLKIILKTIKTVMTGMGQ
jgi:exopolysaccharide biosynthesis polyprenyl glycosylphosphotransferase